MIGPSFKIFGRLLRRDKADFLVNLCGLVLGLACSLLIFLWMEDERGMDKSQERADRIFRVEVGDWANLPTAYRSALTKFPEIKTFVQFNHWESPTLKVGDRSFEARSFVFADDAVFDVFTLRFLRGNPATAFRDPFSLVLTAAEARRIFGTEEALGKTIIYDNKFSFIVTGVIEDQPRLHVEMSLLAPFKVLPAVYGRKEFLNEENWNFLTYVLLHEKAGLAPLEAKIAADYKASRPGVRTAPDVRLRPLEKIYFSPPLRQEKGARHGSASLVILFTAAAVLILLVSCVNFINLTTARASLRAREISLRKIVGAARHRLAFQLLGESALTVFLALLTALGLVEVLIPPFNRMTGAAIGTDYGDPGWLAAVAAVFLFTSLAAGVYPALYLSAQSPFVLLKGQSIRGAAAAAFRKALVVFQFALSVFLIIFASGVFRQLRFLKTKDLGFDPGLVINVRMKGENLGEKRNPFRVRLLANPGVLSVSFSSQVPGTLTTTNTWTVQGKRKPMVVLNADPDFLETLGVRLLEGRNFSWDRPSDRAVTYLVNEKAARFLEIDPLFGRPFRANFGGSEIIGLVQDFHFRSLHTAIAPMAICWNEGWSNTANIKISGNDVPAAIRSIERAWLEIFPEFPFQYSFLDESLANLYVAEGRLQAVLTGFVVLAVFLSCLGLFGLSAFAARRRTREIGIRKVLGARPAGIVALVAREFAWCALAANVAAWPAAYFAIQKWLRGFAYRTFVGPEVFLGAGLLVLGVALATVSIHAVRAAATDPAVTLKYE